MTITNIQDLNSKLQASEELLNMAGYVPFINTVSGGIRITYGGLELISALALAIFFGLKAIFSSAPLNSERFKLCAEYATHGLANMGRGILESGTLLAALVLYPYDNIFKKRFAYSTETLPPETAGYKVNDLFA